MDLSINNKKRVRDDDNLVDLPEVKRLRDDLLDFLDDTETDPATQDLDSVMKSFEEEISASCSPSQLQIVDLTSSDSGESQPDLGYLLEASDDELGLPPSSSTTSVVSSEEEEAKNNNKKTQDDDVVTELVRVSSGVELWPSYDDSFEFGGGVDEFNHSNIGEFVGYDDGGLFEYSNVYFDSGEFSDFSWRQETLPAE